VSLRPLLWLCLALLCSTALAVSDEDALQFDDATLTELVQHPAWFKRSFLDLPSDLKEAIDAGKQGLIVYFGQKRCPYCRQLMEVNFKMDDIVHYTRTHFDVVGVDTWSTEEVTTIEGETLTQRELAQQLGTDFTPSLVFYDKDGKMALRLRGYYPPYPFRAALEYVADGHYKRESFAVYMARGDKTLRFDEASLVEEDFFSPAPYILDRSRFAGERPLAVFFEQGDCHACDVLHTQPLQQPEIRKLIAQFDSVQLNMHSDTPVITPDGRTTTARDWARELELFYAPTILFFDEQGKEIIRLDSVAHFFRLRNVLNYVLTRGYQTYPNYRAWRQRSGDQSQ
jgi:thioredoxin-related protein